MRIYDFGIVIMVVTFLVVTGTADVKDAKAAKQQKVETQEDSDE